MTIIEFYEKVGGDYNEVIGRLLKDERIYKYLNKFVGGDDYNALKKLCDDQNWEEAFRCVHSLKGMCLNLGISKLAASSSALCEELRHGAPNCDISGMLEEVKNDYEVAVSSIKEIDNLA